MFCVVKVPNPATVALDGRWPDQIRINCSKTAHQQQAVLPVLQTRGKSQINLSQINSYIVKIVHNNYMHTQALE